MAELSARAGALRPSETVAIDNRAKELISRGVDLVNLGAGEPDFDSPNPALDSATEAMERGATRYSHPAGLPELREAVSQALHQQLAIRYRPEQIVITSGAKQAIFNSLLATINPGDEVLIPTPCWVTYPSLVRFLGGVPVLVPGSAADQFVPQPALLRQQITAKTKAILLNSPCNPTGTVLGQSEIESLAEFCLEHRLWCISDEIYSAIVYEGTKHYSLAQTSPEMEQNTVVVNGVSKSHAMTGWRIGYCASSLEVSRALSAIQSQTTHHPSTISQHAALGALRKAPDFPTRALSQYAARRQLVENTLGRCSAFVTPKPAGAFYFFLDFQKLLASQPRGIRTSVELCRYLLEDAGVALVPGSAFGVEGFARLSYACASSILEKGLHRIVLGAEGLLSASD